MICGEAKLRPRKKVHSGAFERESPRLNRLSRCTRHRLGTTPAGAGIGCALAQSLPTLLMWRVVQGAGAGASMTIVLAIIRDLFEGQAARTKLSCVTITTMIVPMIAPTAGAALLGLGGWRVIHAVLAGVGLLVLLAMLLGFAESARIDPASRLVPSVIARNYLRVLMHPLCLGYILVNSATFGALFAMSAAPRWS